MREIVISPLMRTVVAAVLGVLFLTSVAMAMDGPAKSPFGAGPQAGPSAGVPGDTTRLQSPGGVMGWLMETQQYYQHEMAGAVRGLKSASPVAAALSLSAISFIYGVLHAAGPGHGKAIISSYVLANRQTVRRGIALSFLSAFFQACSAILLVGILVLLIKATSLQMRSAESAIEIVSWALVALVGVWLLYREVMPLLAARAKVHEQGRAHSHEHAHGHAQGAGCGHPHGADGRHPHGADGGHDHSHDEPAHVHDASCGHVHMPEPAQLAGPWSWRRAISLALTVGIRPCSGAILVLLFALGQGVLWAGVLATFVMAFGTALTVSALAALAVGSREAALVWAGPDSPWAMRLQTGVGLLSAVLVIGLGTAGFLVALHGPAPF